MFEQWKEEILEANLLLAKSGLVPLTWGNVSGINRERGLVAIKPSGVPYDRLTAKDIVIVDLNGKPMDGDLRPSSDLPTHLVLYRAFGQIGGVVHTHSRFATVFAQSGRELPALGTTHADSFYGTVPCTRRMTASEIAGDYETETGNVIAEAFANRDPQAIPGVLVHSHGPFTWGPSAAKAVENAIVLEEVAAMAWHTLLLKPEAGIQQELLDKHYFRKHGASAYYGQKGQH